MFSIANCTDQRELRFKVSAAVSKETVRVQTASVLTRQEAVTLTSAI